MKGGQKGWPSPRCYGAAVCDKGAAFRVSNTSLITGPVLKNVINWTDGGVREISPPPIYDAGLGSSVIQLFYCDSVQQST